MREILRVNMIDLSTSWESVPEEWSSVRWTCPDRRDHLQRGARRLRSARPRERARLRAGHARRHHRPERRSPVGRSQEPAHRGIKESNAGGQAAHTLARLGIAAIAVSGMPADANARYTLTIEADRSVKLERTDAWAGLGNYEVAEAIAATRPEDDRYATITNGPAGELLARAPASPSPTPRTLPNRFAGRGGLGAVMGSKGLKAIVISDKGASFLEHADKEAFVAATKKFTTAIKEHGVSGTGLPMYGTNVLMNILSEAGGLPTRNFSAGTFEFADAIGGETQRDTILARGGESNHGCMTGCAIKCSRYWMDKDGHYKTKGPEYETAWSFGADCDIKDLDEIAELDRVCGDLGLDTIEMGGTLGVYMDSGAIQFGDAAGALAALKDGLEDNVLWDGAEATGKKFGVARIPVVKHQSMPAYDPRSVQGIGVTYATTPQGADHTAGYTITANILGVGGTVNPLSPEGQVELSKTLQIATAMLDSLGLCIFVAFPVLDIPEAFVAIHEMLEAHTGSSTISPLSCRWAARS